MKSYGLYTELVDESEEMADMFAHVLLGRKFDSVNYGLPIPGVPKFDDDKYSDNSYQLYNSVKELRLQAIRDLCIRLGAIEE